MPRKVKLFAARLLLAVVGVACVAMAGKSAHADSDEYSNYFPYNGNGWSISDNGVLTIMSNEGWLNCMLHGYNEYPKKLLIGKDVTNFRLYNLPFDMPITDLVDGYTFDGRDREGKLIHSYQISHQMFPLEIQVEEGNSVFRVLGGLLINISTRELVLSEVGVTNVVVPDGIEIITREAFFKRAVFSVTFPKSLRRIDYQAFAECVNLGEVSLPDSVTELGEGVFSYCKSLQKVTLANQLQSIPANSFCNCAFENIEIPPNVVEIGTMAFYECQHLKQLVCPPSLRTIGRSSFSDCIELNHISLPEGLQIILENAFINCDSLREVILPNSLRQVGDACVGWCDLTLLRIPAHLEFVKFNPKTKKYMPYPYSKTLKDFHPRSVETVIFYGSDYDFGYPAINNAKNVYFLGLPPEDVGQILDRDTTGNIYCSEDYKFEWTRSTIASWVRQKIQFLPTEQLKQITDQEINTTPVPTNTPSPSPTPSPTPKPTETPWPTPMPRPAASPARTAKQEQQGTDPLVFAFAGILALVIAGIVVVAVKPWDRKKKKKLEKRPKV